MKADRQVTMLLVIALFGVGAAAGAGEPAPTTAVAGSEWTTPHGVLTSVYLGFDTEEGDHCSVSLDVAAGIVSTGNSVWSGFECPWPTGGRHFPITEELERSITEALADPDALVRFKAPAPRPEPLGHFEEHRIITSEGMFAPGMLAHTAIHEAMRRLVKPWARRDIGDGLDGLIVTWTRGTEQVRLLGEKHGVLWETRTKGAVQAGVRLRALDIPTRVRLLQLLAALEAVESLPNGAERDVFVRFGDQPLSVAEPIPKPVRELLDFLEE